MAFDILLLNGRLVDGSGHPSTHQDIGIVRGRIAAIGSLQGGRADTVIDVSDKVVCPGFMDIHAHSEFHLLLHPQADSKIRQGVTTEVCGNCGLSAGPLYGEAQERRQAEYRAYGLDLSWSTLSQFHATLERTGIGLNFATLVGHGNIRGSVMGYENRSPTSGERTRMLTLMDQAMQDGALGLSTGLIYPPGVFAEQEEIVDLAQIAARWGGLYATHMRSEGDGLLEAIEESIAIGRQARLPLEISHLKTSGQANWNKLEQAFHLIETAQAAGQSIHCDRYPYTAASTDLDVVLPSWAYAGGNAAELQRLRNPEDRFRMANEIRKTRPYVDAWDKILIGSVATVKNKRLEGKTLAEVVQQRSQEGGCLLDPLDVLFDLLIEEGLQIGAHFFSMSDENLRSILKKPYVMVGSDSSVRPFAGPLSCGKPHPRGFGTFPRVIETYVNKELLLTLEEAIHKMSGLPAKILGIPNRGLLQEGYWADVVVFDPDRLCDQSTFQQPYQPPLGIDHVLVNGQFVVRDSEPTGTLPGKILRSRRSSTQQT